MGYQGPSKLNRVGFVNKRINSIGDNGCFGLECLGVINIGCHGSGMHRSPVIHFRCVISFRACVGSYGLGSIPGNTNERRSQS